MDFKARYLLLSSLLILTGCISNPCIMHDNQYNVYLIDDETTVPEEVNPLYELIYERCNK